MKINLRPVTIQLAGKQLLEVRDGAGYRISCENGTVWITQHRDLRDIVLQRGESFTLDRNGLALVNAVEPAAITIESPPRVRPRSAFDPIARLAERILETSSPSAISL